ncbi:MAG: GspE/PulE family protein [Lachnospirales bacterium]
MKKRYRLGDLLVQAGKVKEEQLLEALKLQKENPGKKLGAILITEGFVSERGMLEALEKQLGIPYVDLASVSIQKDSVKNLKESVARKHNVVIIAVKNGKYILATSDPLDYDALRDVNLALGQEPILALSVSGAITQAIDQGYDAQDEVDKAIQEFSEQNINFGVDSDLFIEEEEVTNAPMVRLVNTILNQAVKQQVSDIHIEPFEDRVRVRFRIDGELIEAMTSTKATHLAIATRIKIIGGMDIAEKRRPQDGRLETVILGRSIDMRISVIPTVFGEKIVIRLLDRSKLMVSREALNLTGNNEKVFNKMLRAPEGMILITGPTGSGKTTTLYTVLSEFNKIQDNIVTVEDPVEYKIDGINQVQVNDKAGLTFASSLRSILRQDPDIVMIGEIRDAETAELACRSAITGHLVFSTLHTNDTVSTVNRLIDMGIDNYLVSSSIVGVVAQRLVRKVCESCKETYTITPDEKILIDVEDDFEVTRGRGCNTCNQTGYKGRTAIHEVLLVDQKIRQMISKDEYTDVIKTAAVENGLVTLNASCLNLVRAGITTVEEMVKVAYSID